jgi:outer membrane receptor for ferrienterochelin and colicins
MRMKYLTAASIVALSLASGATRAQTIDYGSLETLFGEPVTTSATGSPQKVTEAPADMEIITADDIRRSGARDIPGVLAHVAGLDVTRWTNDNADVAIDGYNQVSQPRILVLIDGRQVYADFYGFTPWVAVPVELSEIRQIEVVKGPNSALFGFNAVSGVINIVTYSPLYDNVNTAQLLGGTQGLAEGSATSTFKIGDTAGIRISVGGRADNDFSTPQPVVDVGSRVNSENRGEINISGLDQLTSKVQAGVEMTHSEADEDELTAAYSETYSRYGTWSIKGQITADTELGLVSATAYSNWIQDIGINNTTGLPSYQFNNQVTVAQLQDLYKLDSDNTLRATLEYRHNTVQSNYIPGAHVFYDNYSAGGMWDWKILPSLTLTNALRLDHLALGRDGYLPVGSPFANSDWDRDINQPSYNSGLVWRPTDDDTFRITAARGVQLPNLTELGALAVQIGPIVVGGQPDVNPTTVDKYELGWDRQIPALNAQLRVGLYEQRTGDIGVLFGNIIHVGNNVLIASQNIGSSKAHGAEFELKGTFAQDWRWGLSYTPEWIKDDLQPTLSGTTDFQHTTPDHIVKGNIGWASGPWEADLYGRYESATQGLEATAVGSISAGLVPIKDYVAFDARLGYKVTDWATLAISGQNITQGTQQQSSAPDVERIVMGSVTVNF